MSENSDAGTGPSDKKGRQKKDSDVQQQEEEEEEEKKQDVSEAGNPHSSNPSGVVADEQTGATPSREEDHFLSLKKRTSWRWHRQMTADQGQTPTAIDVKSESKTGQLSEAKKQSGSRSTRTGTRVGRSWREVLLFEMQLQANDIGRSKLTIPWETAGNHFPPRTQSYKSESILVSDTRNNNWRMIVMNNSLINAYLVVFGWKEFATAHDLEATDVVSFFRPVLPLQNYHYLVKCVKAAGSYDTRLAERKFHGSVGKQIQIDKEIDRLELKYLFIKQITSIDAENNTLQIPTAKAEEHFPDHLRNSAGSYNEEEGEVLLVSDAQNRKWRMKIESSLSAESYEIAGDWNEFVAAHNLQAMDIIRFYKVVKPAPDKHYIIECATVKGGWETEKKSPKMAIAMERARQE